MQKKDVTRILKKKRITGQELGRILLFGDSINLKERPKQSYLLSTNFVSRLEELSYSNSEMAEYLKFVYIHNWLKYCRLFVGTYEQIGNGATSILFNSIKDLVNFIECVISLGNKNKALTNKLVTKQIEEIEERLKTELTKLESAYKTLCAFNLILEAIIKELDIQGLEVYKTDKSIMKDNIEAYNAGIDFIKETLRKTQLGNIVAKLSKIDLVSFELGMERKKIAEELFKDTGYLRNYDNGLTPYPLYKVRGF